MKAPRENTRHRRQMGRSVVPVLVALSVGVLFAAAQPGDSGFREWNDLHDRRFDAKLLGVSEESVRLVNRAGKQIDFPYEELSSSDKKYALDWQGAGPAAKPAGPPTEFREWTDRQGRKIEARLIDIGERKVKLQDRAGKQTSVPMGQLVVSDQFFIHEWDSFEKPKQSPNPIPPRQWENARGQHFKAQLVDTASRTVRLENEAGKQIVYLIADLSRADRFLLERIGRNEASPGLDEPGGGIPELDGADSIRTKLAGLGAAGPGFTAVLINGDTSDLHKGNLVTAYQTLRKMGHEDWRIVVLSSHFAPSSEFRRGLGSITAAASPGNVRAVFNGLQETCGSEDTVFVYTTGHGVARDSGDAFLVLEERRGFAATEFGEFVGGLEGKFISVMDQCFSGGMVEAIPSTRPNTIAISAAPPDDKTYCKFFSETFWASIQDAGCDADQDGVVSISEAYELALAEHKRRVNWVSTDGMCHIQPAGVVLMPTLR